MKRKVRIVLLIVCILILLGGGVYLYMESLQRTEEKDMYEDLQEEVKTEEPQEVEEPDVIPIDFAKLRKKNPDIYAWIQIEDTNIDYPIVQHETDDSYYLNHTIEGKAGYPGSIYTERVNAKDFSDFNTVVYGHDMKDGSMFKHLHKFENDKFFKNHDTIHVYTETEHKIYKIFAAVVYSDKHLMYAYNYENEKEREAFINSLYETHSMKNLYREDVQVDADSHILTLSTCIGSQPTKRYLVVAVETEE